MQRQFLVHSYLYYSMNESVLEDHDYDRICFKMVELMRQNPEEALKSPYYELCEPCGDSGSGFYITKYPPEIVTTSLRRLYFHKKPPEDFGEWIKRFGFRIIN